MLGRVCRHLIHDHNCSGLITDLPDFSEELLVSGPNATFLQGEERSKSLHLYIMMKNETLFA